jgi:hypothetical protein
MTAISRSKVKIWVVPKDTDPSTLVDLEKTAIDHKGYIAGQIKSYSQTGGEKDVESDPLFGGYVDKEKPVSQFELALDIVPALETPYVDLWDSFIYTQDSAGSGLYTSASIGGTQPSDQMVVIQGVTGSSYKSYAFNNCNVTMLDQEHNADDNKTYSMTMKFAPETSSGVANLMTKAVAATGLPAFDTLDNN